MVKRLTLLLILMMLVLLIACSGGNNEESTDEVDGKDETVEQEQNIEVADRTGLTISAAISLTDALEEIKEVYEEDHPVELSFNLGSSGKLAQQIQQGAPSDIFISANQEWMDTLEEENEIISETRADVTGNKLVLITSKSSNIAYQSFNDISSDDVEKVAIGNPESVPAGQYSKEALHSLNLWDELEDKLVYAKDVRQVLTYVESNNTEIGFVYESDALSSDKITILATAEEGLHEAIIYPLAVITHTKHEQEAKDFAAFMETDEAQEILVKHGFRK